MLHGEIYMFHHPIIICKPIIVSSIWNVEIGCGLPYLNEHKSYLSNDTHHVHMIV